MLLSRVCCDGWSFHKFIVQCESRQSKELRGASLQSSRWPGWRSHPGFVAAAGIAPADQGAGNWMSWTILEPVFSDSTQCSTQAVALSRVTFRIAGCNASSPEMPRARAIKARHHAVRFNPSGGGTVLSGMLAGVFLVPSLARA